MASDGEVTGVIKNGKLGEIPTPFLGICQWENHSTTVLHEDFPLPPLTESIGGIMERRNTPDFHPGISEVLAYFLQN